MARPTVVEVDLDAIAQNLDALMALARPGVECIAVVKANAYGHGAVPVARALAARGIRRFAVACLEEATHLRDAAVPGRILIMGYPAPSEAREIVAQGFEAVVSAPEQIVAFDAAGRAAGVRACVHLKFDTGMGRVGFPVATALNVARDAAARPGIALVGAMTHFAVADEEQGVAFTREQIAVFLRVRQELEYAGLRIPLWHAANSAGLLYHPESHLDAVRPGVSLYGAYPSPGMSRPVRLRQAMTFKTRIAAIREMPASATVGYGRTKRLERQSRIGLLPVGYADGYDRRLSNRGEVLVRGRRVPVAGRVSMDLVTVDLTDVPEAAAGDEVVLYGSQGSEAVTIESVADLLGTVRQEVMTSVGARVPRVYKGDLASAVVAPG